LRIARRILIAVGVLLALIAISLDTSVSTGYGRVHNIGLQSQQQMLLILGCVMFLAGVILFAVEKIKQTPEEDARDRAVDAELARKVAGYLRPVPKEASERREYIGPDARECTERIASRGYKVTRWFGRMWTVRAPDGKSLQLALSLSELHRVMREIEAETALPGNAA